MTSHSGTRQEKPRAGLAGVGEREKPESKVLILGSAWGSDVGETQFPLQAKSRQAEGHSGPSLNPPRIWTRDKPNLYLGLKYQAKGVWQAESLERHIEASGDEWSTYLLPYSDLKPQGSQAGAVLNATLIRPAHPVPSLIPSCT